MMRAILSSWPLLLGMALLMVSSGLLVTLLTVRAVDLGFSDTAIGFMQAAYPAGALAGCIAAPRLVASVGHVRAFAALASLCSVAALVHLVTFDPWSWGAMRALAGFCFPGLFVVSEAWLNAKAENSTRGALLSVYFVIQIGGSALGQGLLSIPDPQGTLLFVLVSILISLSLIPMLISRTHAPPFEVPERFGLREVWRVSPLGAGGAAINGVTAAMFYVGLGIHAQSTGLGVSATGALVAATGIGGMLGQIPLARLSDKMDRRHVIAGAAAGSMLLALMLTQMTQPPIWSIALAAALALPIYSLCVAHTNDYLSPAQIVTASGALVLAQNGGAILGPVLAAQAISLLGGAGLFWAIAGVQAAMLVFTLRQMFYGRERATETGQAVPISHAATPVAAELNPEAPPLEPIDQ